MSGRDPRAEAVAPWDPKARIRRLVVDGELDANAATRLLLEIDKQQRELLAPRANRLRLIRN